MGGMGACGVDPMTSEPLCLAGKGVEGTKEPWGLERLSSKARHLEKLRLKSEHQLRVGRPGRRRPSLELMIILMRG